MAQDMSSKIYLTVYLSTHPTTTTAMVVGLGQKSFTLLVVELDLEHRVFVEGLGGSSSSSTSGGGGSSITCQWYPDGMGGKGTKTLVLKASGGGGSSSQLPPWGSEPLPLSLFTSLVVRCSGKVDVAPIKIKIDILGLATPPPPTTTTTTT